MKNTALITLLISGMAFSAVAQDRGHRTPKTAEEIAQMRTDRLTEQLALTGDQQQEVYALNLESAKKMKAEREERAARMAELREARAAKMKEWRTEMKASKERLNEILTPEQREVLEQQRAERTEKMKSLKMRKGHWAGKTKGDRARRGKRGMYKFHKNADSTQTVSPGAETTNQ